MEKDIFFRVKYAETDKMGVVYYANYYIWFEIGRNELFRELGFPYVELEKKGLLLPVVKSSCEYKKPAEYDDLIMLRTRIENFTPVRITFCYNVYKDDHDELLATGETVHAFVSENKKPVNLKKKHNDLYSILGQQLS